jgi:hypothetical protein
MADKMISKYQDRKVELNERIHGFGLGMSLYRYYFRTGACLYIRGNWSLEDSFLFPLSFRSIILLEILHCALVPSHSNAFFAKHIQYFINHQGGAE